MHSGGPACAGGGDEVEDIVSQVPNQNTPPSQPPRQEVGHIGPLECPQKLLEVRVSRDVKVGGVGDNTCVFCGARNVMVCSCSCLYFLLGLVRPPVGTQA